MDLAETTDNVLVKTSGSTSDSNPSNTVSTPHPTDGFITEKLYMSLEMYLQNKDWSPSIEWLQCFSDLTETSTLPSASYLQMMASRIGLDRQGRLILRENGKIILPYEHFANAIKLKHMNGPHGLHLGVEATVRAVVDSYTIGKDQFGMEKEFILEVIQNCPNPACHYFKTHLELIRKSMKQALQPAIKLDAEATNMSDENGQSESQIRESP